jgi:formate dehydrogenase iron-sulfur subunit
MAGDKSSRRDFLKEIAAGVAATFLVPTDVGLAGQGECGFLIDTTRCQYCMRCVDACAHRHGDVNPGTFYTHVTLTYPKGESLAPLAIPFHCMHCSDPPCVKVCQGQALSKTALGAVTLDPSRCIGCLSCINVCPFKQTLHYLPSPASSAKIFKCDMCYDRLVEGLKPACVDACEEAHHYALSYGPADEILYEGTRRASEIDGLLLYPGETRTLLVFRKEEFNEPKMRDLYGITQHYSGEARVKAVIARAARAGWIPIAGGLVYYIVNWRRNRVEDLAKVRGEKGD